jgi:hypothetical protein
LRIFGDNFGVFDQNCTNKLDFDEQGMIRCHYL